MTHRISVPVRFAELDPYGHVNHAVYVSWFEEGRVRALRDIDLDLADLADAGYQFVVTEVSLRYRRSAVACDTVIVETRVGRIRRVSATWEQRVLRPTPEGEDVLVEASVTAAVTDTAGSPTRPPAWINERLARLTDPG